MKKLFVRYGVFLLLVCPGLTLLLLGCGGDKTPTASAIPEPTVTQPPTPSETDTPTPTIGLGQVIVHTPEPFNCYELADLPQTTEPASAIPVEALQQELPVIPGQIILTGPPEDILTVINRLADILTLTPIGPPPGEGVLFGAPTGDGQWAIALYTTSEAIPEAIRQIYAAVIEINLSGTDPVVVLATPNRLIGNPWGVDADPWGVDADPWGVDADPWGVDADPWGVDADAAKGDPERAWIPGEQVAGAWNQWALAEGGGVGVFELPPTTGGVGQRVPDIFGDGIDVFVLDTSPFDTEGKAEIIGRDMCVYLPELIVDIAPDTKESQVDQHGYFVSGLVRFVAPNSRLHLVRILNEDGVGDVFSFLAVMYQIKAARNAVETDINMRRSVVNLSMSLHEFEDEDDDKFLPDADQIDELMAVLPPEYHVHITQTQVIPALELMMDDLYNSGAVIVAASGNNSNITAAVPTDIPTGIPANLTSSVGVAGSNIGTGRSCFSNQPEKSGGLSAPAGDGIPKSGDSCAYPFPWPTLPKCPNGVSEYDCHVALTSVVVSETGKTQYMHWLGTSFATPLVTGAAAIMLEAGTETCTPAAITKWLREYHGILNVPEALDYAREGCP